MSKGAKQESASVYLGAELRGRLEAAAARERRTLSQLIRIALTDWLDQHHPR